MSNSQEEDRDEEKKGRGNRRMGRREKMESKMGQEGKETRLYYYSRKCGMCETDRLNIRCALVPRGAVQTLKKLLPSKHAARTCSVIGLMENSATEKSIMICMANSCGSPK